MKKILLINDPGTTLGHERSFLDRANVKLFTARTGREALRIYREELPDMVVTEDSLSDIGGLELCREIFSIKRCPVLMITKTGKDETINACREAGVSDFIYRPVNQKELIKKVGNLLNVPQREDFKILMKVRVEGKREGNFFMGNTIDISTSGVLIETHNKDIDVGDLLECNFFLPWKLKAVNIYGEVTRKVEGAESCRYGIRFQGLDSSLKDEIGDYIKKKQKIAEQ